MTGLVKITWALKAKSIFDAHSISDGSHNHFFSREQNKYFIIGKVAEL